MTARLASDARLLQVLENENIPFDTCRRASTRFAWCEGGVPAEGQGAQDHPGDPRRARPGLRDD